MPRTVMEYPATDKWLYLYLTANSVLPTDVAKSHTVHHHQFDPDVIAAMDDDLGIPSTITCAGLSFNLNDDGDLHSIGGYSFSMTSMTLIWHQMIAGRATKTRDDGPAEVVLSGFRANHVNGARVDFTLTGWKFNWYQRGVMRRLAGPYSITGSETQIGVAQNGALRATRSPSAQYLWNHPGGGNITESMAQKTIRENEIVMNRMHPGASVFDNEMEQVMFYGGMAAA